ncbi:GTP_EFTU domain-containing protein/EFG_C domain-containing protein/GTP_EFTU_D2 domain-containing protein/LepA_C domain-containing protein [Cephalotus follicularis]|uniref:Translation factor GUF1 homolog, mitochondrial n=1 Tax=Cephalotus follicularis TaxID=3775 RepID=A0A1Q3ALP6_CEPFO|nr:GTP_EFTU domain-containing protein/EFG_C domain-containing protein/GTP_EFTU_D2 domain-containing protein/LepA_C domain-containing protein [Cephalotus follicularis]
MARELLQRSILPSINCQHQLYPKRTRNASVHSFKPHHSVSKFPFSSINGYSSTRCHRFRALCHSAKATNDVQVGQDRLLKVPISNIRNFCIIAHIDHGKSTLVDKLLQMTGTVQQREMKEQFLDNMDLERERGITIKLQAARMRYMFGNEAYCLNLIDTPGHVDFSYEVSRSLAACEGALLVVDASQGVEAQTLANVYLALENNLEIITVLNKIDLPGAEPDRVVKEIEEIVGLDCSNAMLCSAKMGIGIIEILNAIVERIPPPNDTAESPLRALIFDSYYDPYRGVIVYFRVIDGTLKKGDRIHFMASEKDYTADEIGVLSPNQLQVEELYSGEVGYLSASIRSVADARVGDTITHYGRRAENLLPGYEEATPMVFCGLFPVDADQYPELRDALEKLQLNDAALKFEPETSSAMGFGFRCGFLGLLHMEIVQERLEREYNLNLITTAPSVVYRVNCVDGDTVECSNPSILPEPGRRRSIEEPFVKIDMLTPKDYIGSLMELAQDRRGEFKEIKFISEIRASISYELPLSEMVGDFFDQLKSRSKGYASMEYTFIGYKESDLVKLDIQINGECVEPLATIVHKDKAYAVGRALTLRLKELIPRHMFKVPIQKDMTNKRDLWADGDIGTYSRRC